MQNKLLPKAALKQKWHSMSSKIMGLLGEQEDFGVDVDDVSVHDRMQSMETNNFNDLLHYDEWEIGRAHV